MAEPVLDMSEIVELYKADARRMVLEMRQALERWDEFAQGGPARQDLRRLSHQMRGSGRTYGFRSVTRICKAMERIVLKLEQRRWPAEERLRRSLLEKTGRLEHIFAA